MTDRTNTTRRQSWALLAVVLYGAVAANGCSYHSIKCAAKAIPASRLDRSLLGERKDAQVPILLCALGQSQPDSHRVGPGDTLAIFVYGVLPPSVDETPVLSQYQTLNQRYYPPGGSVEHPSTGLPMTVLDNGALELPLIGQLPVAGLTMSEVHEKIRKSYMDASVIAAGRERISVNLITKRVHRVVVMRQDSPAEQAIVTSPQSVNMIHRGSGEVLDLPSYENDVLHALTASGGMPGTDAAREIWVIRNCAIDQATGVSQTQIDGMLNRYQHGEQCGPSVVRIPLFVYPGEALPFRPEDVVLNAGDVVYIPRRMEYFYTGGLLKGAKIPLPADQDLDVIEAIALATNSAGGPLGLGGAAVQGGSPGYIVAPSRVLILRKLADGNQITIRVDLDRAAEDAKERILIQPDDMVMLYHKPTEATVNGVLTFFGFGFTVPIVP